MKYLQNHTLQSKEKYSYLYFNEVPLDSASETSSSPVELFNRDLEKTGNDIQTLENILPSMREDMDTQIIPDSGFSIPYNGKDQTNHEFNIPDNREKGSQTASENPKLTRALEEAYAKVDEAMNIENTKDLEDPNQALKEAWDSIGHAQATWDQVRNPEGDSVQNPRIEQLKLYLETRGLVLDTFPDASTEEQKKINTLLLEGMESMDPVAGEKHPLRMHEGKVQWLQQDQDTYDYIDIPPNKMNYESIRSYLRDISGLNNSAKPVEKMNPKGIEKNPENPHNVIKEVYEAIKKMEQDFGIEKTMMSNFTLYDFKEGQMTKKQEEDIYTHMNYILTMGNNVRSVYEIDKNDRGGVRPDKMKELKDLVKKAESAVDSLNPTNPMMEIKKKKNNE